MINVRSFCRYAIGFVAISVFGYCNKERDFLNSKPQSNLSTVSSLSDCRALLNDELKFNQNYNALPEVMTDDHYVIYDYWIIAGTLGEQRAYIFANDLFGDGKTAPDWGSPYEKVYSANIILDALSAIPKTSSNQQEYNEIKGEALFFRSYAFYDLLQTFSMPYDSSKALSQIGIPLRLTSDINLKSVRSSESTCFKQIISDLDSAEVLLSNDSKRITNPTKNAAIALKARIYFAYAYYKDALVESQKLLENKSDLIDYNALDLDNPYSLCNNYELYPLKEEIFHATLGSYGLNAFTEAIVDSTLYATYGDGDLRKNAFFSEYDGGIRFKGSYEFNQFGLNFCGLAVDEIVLIQAEANARLGHLSEAMTSLNFLLSKRYSTDKFVPLSITNQDSAVQVIINERRKELLYRGIRWTDLRRLNQETKYAQSVVHVMNGVQYILKPNDLKYALSIPSTEIKISGITQNPR